MARATAAREPSGRKPQKGTLVEPFSQPKKGETLGFSPKELNRPEPVMGGKGLQRERETLVAAVSGRRRSPECGGDGRRTELPSFHRFEPKAEGFEKKKRAAHLPHCPQGNPAASPAPPAPRGASPGWWEGLPVLWGVFLPLSCFFWGFSFGPSRRLFFGLQPACKPDSFYSFLLLLSKGDS